MIAVNRPGSRPTPMGGQRQSPLLIPGRLSCRRPVVPASVERPCPLHAAPIFSAPRRGGRLGSAAGVAPGEFTQGERRGMAGKGGVQAERLKSLIERIERLEEERAATPGGIRQGY